MATLSHDNNDKETSRPGQISKGDVVAVVGSGLMGAGIAQVAAASGHRVKLYDVRPEALEKAVANIGKNFQKLVAKQRMTLQEAKSGEARIEKTDSLSNFADARLVIEAVAEDLDSKRKLFGELESITSSDCILASNTSSLSLTAIASGLRHPERVVGMHFFNPAPLMELVEIVRGLATSDACAETAFATAAAWGKTPVYAKSTPGFIVNRVARPYYAEALRLLNERAATPASIDTVMRDAGGFRMGPFELMDLIGLDTNFAVTRSVFHAYFCDPRFTPSLIQQELVDAGHLGRKSGRGFYDYGEGALKPAPTIEPAAVCPRQISILGRDAFTEALQHRLQNAAIMVDIKPGGDPQVKAGAATLAVTDGRTATSRAIETGIADFVVVDLARDYRISKSIAVARAASCGDAAYASAVGMLQSAGYAVVRLRDLPGLAVMRTVAMLANEAADAVNQGVCSIAGVNAAMRKGVNYPAGPLAWADEIGVDKIHTVLMHLAAFYGEDRYRTSPLIREMVLTGRKFGQLGEK